MFCKLVLFLEWFYCIEHFSSSRNQNQIKILILFVAEYTRREKTTTNRFVLLGHSHKSIIDAHIEDQ